MKWLAPLKFLFITFFLTLFLQPIFTNGEICPEVSCGDVLVDFPFRLTGQPECCGNPNFNLSCRSRYQLPDQTIVTFPFFGEFSVDTIGYSPPSLLISDPCIAKRLLQGFQLSDAAPFKPRYPEWYMFFNCSSKSNESMGYPAIRFSCLSGTNFSVWAIPTAVYNQSSSLGSCQQIANILIPLATPDWPINYIDDFLFTWEEPDCLSSCNYCESHGSNCPPENVNGVDGDCSPNHFRKKSGHSSGAKYALIFIVGTPIILVVLCIIYYNVKVHYYDQRQQPNVEITSLTAETQLAVITLNGLDGSRIEAYPITLLGESFQLPRPNDNACSICLSEYKAKETIRTIPDCNHYFHANCIDEWLKLNAACPVCRSMPDQDSAHLITHSTLSSSSAPPP